MMLGGRYVAAFFLLLAASAVLLFLYFMTIDPPAQAHIESSAAAFDRNDLDFAIASADDALALEPSNTDALLAKAAALAQKGSLEFKEAEYGAQAIALAQEIIAVEPENAEAWRIMGYAYEIMERYDEAHRAYERAVELDPLNARAVAQQAHAWMLQGDERAEAGYRRAVELDPDNEHARLGLARLAASGNAEEAYAVFADVAASAPNARLRAEAAYSAGILAAGLGDAVAAEDYLRYSTTADPSYPLGWAGLAAMLFDKAIDAPDMPIGERESLISESFDMLEAAIALNEDQSSAYLQLAVQLIALERTPQAAKILEKLPAIVGRDITLSASDKAEMLERVERVSDLLDSM